jgi:hypothetical protein
MTQIAIILGSTRPGRRGETVARSDAGVCGPGEHQETALTTMLDEILEWSRALRMLRDPTTSTDPRPGPT